MSGKEGIHQFLWHFFIIKSSFAYLNKLKHMLNLNYMDVPIEFM